MEAAKGFYASVLDSVNDGIWVSDEQDRIVFCNAAMQQIAGVELDAIIGLSVTSDFSEGTTGKFLPYYLRARESLRPVNYESEVITPAGRDTIQSGSLTPLLVDGRFAGMICTIQDVTQERRVERDLLEAGSRATQYLQIAPSIILALDTEGVVTLLNKEGGRVLGCDPDDALGDNWFEAFIPESIRHDLRRVFDQLLNGDMQDVEDYENEIVTRDGTQKRLIRWHNTLLKDDQGDVTGLLCSGQDITQQRITERALRRSQSIVDSTTDVIITTDLSGTITSTNAAVEDLYGYKPEQLIGKPVSLLWNKESFGRLRDVIAALLEGNRIQSLEETTVDRWGNDVPVLMSLAGLQDANGAVVELLAVTKGIRSLRDAQQALARSEERFREALDGNPFPTAVVDEQDQNILYWSKSARQLFGHNPQTTSEWYMLAYPDPDYRAQVLEQWRHFVEQARDSGKATYTGEYRITCQDGLVRTCELYAQFIPGNLVVTMNDVSEQQRTAAALAESEVKYRTLVQNVQHGVVIAQADPVRLRFANPAMSDITGFTEGELLAMRADTLPKLIHTDDRHRFFSTFKMRIAGNPVPKQAEYRIVRKDGAIRWVTLYSSLIDYLGEKATLTTFIDRTEQKNAQDAVREVNLRMRNAVKAGKIGLWDLDLAANRAYYSPEWKAQIGYADAEIIDTVEEWQSRVHPDDLDATLAITRQAIAQASKEPAVTEFRFRHKDGSYRWIQSHAAILADDSGKAVRMLGSHVDITDHKRVEAALRLSKTRFEEAQIVAQVGSWDYDIATDTPTWSKQMFEIFGLDPAEGEPSWEGHERMIHPDDWPRIDKSVRTAVADGLGYGEEFRIVHPDGSEVWAHSLGRPIRDEEGTIVRLAGTVQNITARKTAEIALREAKKRNQALLDYSPACHKIVDRNLTLQYMSQSGVCMLGLGKRENVYGKPYPFSFFPEAFQQEMRRELEKVLVTGQVATMEGRATDTAGHDVWLHSTLVPVPDEDGNLDYITVVTTDVTENRLLEARLRQSQKLESIGTLASGVAHEINNPLMGILNYAELMKDESSSEKELEYADNVLEEGNRVATIVRNLLSFARQDGDTGSLADVRDAIDRSLSLTRSSLEKDGIQLEVDVSSSLPLVMCRIQEIEQIIINLLTNARDALDQRYSGFHEDKWIRITAQTIVIDGAQRLRITVSDHGIGIPGDALDRIFDPFFTTKPREKGTGLGLSVSYGIAAGHGGNLWVETEPGEFTRFHLDLPLSNRSIE